MKFNIKTLVLLLGFTNSQVKMAGLYKSSEREHYQSPNNVWLGVTNFSQVYSVAHTGTGCALFRLFSHGGIQYYSLSNMVDKEFT